MPRAPTPAPPSSSCRDRARLRNQSVIGAVLRAATLRNSALMQTWINELVRDENDIGTPGFPKRTGITTV
jgi:hypothetical protein